MSNIDENKKDIEKNNISEVDQTEEVISGEEEIIEEDKREEEIIEEEIIAEEQIADEIIKEEIIKEELIEEEITEEEIIKEEIIADEIIKDEIIEEEIIKDEIIKDEITEDEIIKDAIIEDEIIKEDKIEEDIIKEDRMEVKKIEEGISNDYIDNKKHKRNKKNKNNISKKDIKKIIRGTFQGIVLLLLVFILLRTLLLTNTYTPYEDTDMPTKTSGFIALSYFGVSRIGDDVTITTKRFEEHIRALKENGYVTITQQDILDYYLDGKELPEKALFLMFEDGYAGTAIFAGKLMEKYNLKATMLTYGDKLTAKDPKFLTPKDLLQLEKETYWEIGTNGYRLSYINVFDKDDNYLGELSSYEFVEVRNKLNRKYNQYLMDYIRDEYGVPKETYQQMKNRIITDYQLLDKSYMKGINYVPKLHVLMHANTERFGNNQRVSDVNEEMIKDMFLMNFNREGFSVNNQECDLYDLTRMQPQAYWSPNHLLMRIWDDTKQDITFEVGDIEESKQFESIKGATQFGKESIIITSLPSDSGLIKLKNSENYQEVKLDVTVSGNVLGGQGIYLRADEDLQNYVKVQLINNELRIIECVEGIESIISSENLEFLEDIDTSNIQLFTSAKRRLKILLRDDIITVEINGQDFSPDVTLQQVKSGSLLLESECDEEAYSQRNLYDDVYDGVFEQLVVSLDDSKEIVYDNKLHGLEKRLNRIKEAWSNIINWFVENL